MMFAEIHGRAHGQPILQRPPQFVAFESPALCLECDNHNDGANPTCDLIQGCLGCGGGRIAPSPLLYRVAMQSGKWPDGCPQLTRKE